ncbi:hypothetical protein RBH20_07095 [Haloarcula sp. H-GB4]|uniref:hypothetical protein n=1 Tax=Haloarcula sp. H-GB4 TaxID=3069755 RepID=UPI0027AEB07D|nr:hypothetical protein [Haloarcula sp. H-GB4]MDQ2072306.1 hypothetical protein [Haloarcula sp. H-GB4]
MNTGTLKSVLVPAVLPAVLLAGVELLTASPLAITGPFIFVFPEMTIAAVSGMLLGPLALIGIGLGVLFDIFLTGVSPLTDLLLLTVGGWCALFTTERRYRERLGETQLIMLLREYGLRGTGAVLFSAAVFSWVYVITNTGRFYPRALVLLVNLFVSVVLLGGIAISLCYPLFRNSRLYEGLSTIRAVSEKGSFPRTPGRSLSFVSIVWLLTGSGISVFFDVLDLVPRFVFRRRGIEALLSLKQISVATDSGQTVQILYGGVMLGLLIVLLWSVPATDRG